mgnify:CR=1 FL=1
MRIISSALTFAMLILSGCSSSFMDSRQVVDVRTSPAMSASCILQDNARSYNVTAPGIVEVNQGDGPLRVSCSNAASKGEAVIEESFNTDAILGEKPGMVLDTITGSYQKYPRNITVPMAQ